jgi:nucleoside-diphosphate-sugar epimerase
MAFTRFVRAAVLDEVITLYGTGEQIRDFTYVDDVVEANLRVGDADTAQVPAGAVYNVAGGSSVSMNEVLELLGTISGKEVRVERSAAVPGDVLRTGGTTDAIRRATGWDPKVGLREGLEEQYRWATTVLA